MSDDSVAKVDPHLFRKTMGHWASGVTVMTTLVDGAVHGMTASAFCSVSLEPALVLVAVGHKARMHGALQKAMKYGISVLAQGQEDVSQHFAGRPQEGLEVAFRWHDGWPLIEGSVAQLICTVVDAHVAGDHTLYIGRVEYLHYLEGSRPLLYFAGGYRAVAM